MLLNSLLIKILSSVPKLNPPILSGSNVLGFHNFAIFTLSNLYSKPLALDVVLSITLTYLLILSSTNKLLLFAFITYIKFFKFIYIFIKITNIYLILYYPIFFKFRFCFITSNLMRYFSSIL